MRILQITPQLPVPPDSGGRTAMYGWLREAARRHSITLLSFTTDPPDSEALCTLADLCERVVTVERASPSPVVTALRAAWTGAPHNLVPFESREMWKRVAECARPELTDLVQIEFVHMARYGKGLPSELPRVLRTHNVESSILDGYAMLHRNPVLAAYARFQARRLHRYEAAILAGFDRCVAISELDAASLREMAPHAKVEAIPVGIDTDRFRPDALEVRTDPRRIATTGDYAWAPTRDGLRFLIDDILPRIRIGIPSVRLSVIGRDPPELGSDAAQSGLDVVGRVPDVRPEILRAAVFVSPTRIGSGIRVKTLEALALGRAVVATSLGCAGIDVRAGEHLLVADDPDAIAGHVVGLLRDPDRAARLGAAAAARIRERYGWSALVDRFDDVYARALAERRSETRR
jgi:glycosyltransferase involved in cell wall biosynthesis